jgi:hypothetical protein
VYRPHLERLEDRFLLSSSPVAIRDSYETNALQPFIVDAAAGVLANDQFDGQDSLSAVLVDPPQHGRLVLAEDGSFMYLTFGNYRGTDQFTYRARRTSRIG